MLAFFVPIAIFYAAALAGATWLDRRAAGGADQFHIRRIHDPKLSLGVANPIQLVVESRSPRTLELTVADEPPLSFTVIGSAAQTTNIVAPRNAHDQLCADARSARRLSLW